MGRGREGGNQVGKMVCIRGRGRGRTKCGQSKQLTAKMRMMYVSGEARGRNFKLRVRIPEDINT